VSAVYRESEQKALPATFGPSPRLRGPAWRVNEHGIETPGSMEADLLIHDPALGQVVVDAKYKASVSSGNLQQIVAYCLLLGARCGVLVVPAGAIVDRRSYLFRSSELGAIRVHVVELRTAARNVQDWKTNAAALGAELRERLGSSGSRRAAANARSDAGR